MKILTLLLISLVSTTVFSQIKLTKINTVSIPSTIVFAGELKTAVQWTDSIGTNIVLTTETGEVSTPNTEDFRDAAVYAYRYLVRRDSIELIWKLNDYVRECPVDLEASFIPKTFSVTDLDKNGITEVWLMYKTACRGDVSPSTLKIIMYEGSSKYALRGTTKVKYSETDFIGGEYEWDQRFSVGPEVFRMFARQLWEKNSLEYGE